MRSECSEIEETLTSKPEKLASEIGDVLFDSLLLLLVAKRDYNIDTTDILRSVSSKLKKRLESI